MKIDTAEGAASGPLPTQRHQRGDEAMGGDLR
jgi:hypothetical protein